MKHIFQKAPKGLLILFMAVSSVVAVQADDSIVVRNVTVEREYKPVINDAGKINSLPKVLENTVEKAPANFSHFNLPISVDYNIQMFSAAGLEQKKHDENNKGFACLGLGNYFNTMAELAVPIIQKSDMQLDFLANHLGTFDDKAHSTTKATMSFDKYFKSFNLYAGLGGGHEYLKYYGNNFDGNRTPVDLGILARNQGSYTYKYTDNQVQEKITLSELAKASTTNTFLRLNTFVGVQSLSAPTGIRYLAETRYNMYNTQNGVTEHTVHTQGGFSTTNKQDRIGVDLDIYNMFYSIDDQANFNTWKDYSVLAVNPYYNFERRTFNLRLGLKSSFSFVQGKQFNPSADIRGEWYAVPTILSVYGGVSGGFNVNTMDKIMTENPYLYSNLRVMDTYSPYTFFAGLKLKAVYNLLIDGFLDFQQIDNQYFFINKTYTNTNSSSALYSNRFDVTYSAASLLKIGMRANYNYKNLINVELKGGLNSWTVKTEQYAWNKPIWETSMSTNVKLNRNFMISANVFADGGRYAKMGSTALKMNSIIDVNLGASYSYNNWFTAFAKMNNLLNRSYQNFYGYDAQGLNVLAGAAFSF